MIAQWLSIALVVALATANHVIVLDDSNFEMTLAEKNPILVEFYAPWCGHCKALEPEFEEAAKMLAGKNAKVFLGKVDATAENAKQLQKAFKISGFPTLKFFPSGKADDPSISYDGQRKAADIVKWLEKQTSSPYVPLTTAAEITELKASLSEDEEKIVVIGAFEKEEQTLAFSKYAKTDTKRDYYAIVGNKNLAAQLDPSASIPFIQVLRSFNISNPAITTSTEQVGDEVKLEKFLTVASEPVSAVTTYSNEDIKSTVKQDLHVVEFYAPWCGYCTQFAPKYEKVAQHYLQQNAKVVIAKYDATQDDEITANEGIESFPTLRLYRDGAAATFQGEFDEESVIKFIDQKLVAKAETLADSSKVEDFVKENTALVACISEADETAIDNVAFQAATAQFKVAKLRCAAGSESASIYVDGAKVSTYPSESSISDAAKFRKWYKRATMKPVFRFDDSIFDDVMSAEYKFLIFYFNHNLQGNEPELADLEKIVASGAYPDAAFTYASSSEDYLMQHFNLKASDVPAVRLLTLQGEDGLRAYYGPSKLNAAEIEKMFKDYESGTLEVVPAASEDEDMEAGDEDDHDDEDEHDHSEEEVEYEEVEDEDDDDQEGEEEESEDFEEDEDDDDDEQDEL